MYELTWGNFCAFLCMHPCRQHWYAFSHASPACTMVLDLSVQLKLSMREILRLERSLGKIYSMTISISDQMQCSRCLVW